MKISNKKLQVIRGGLPELGHLSDDELLTAWRDVQGQEESLRTVALGKTQALREAGGRLRRSRRATERALAHAEALSTRAGSKKHSRRTHTT